MEGGGPWWPGLLEGGGPTICGGPDLMLGGPWWLLPPPPPPMPFVAPMDGPPFLEGDDISVPATPNAVTLTKHQTQSHLLIIIIIIIYEA